MPYFLKKLQIYPIFCKMMPKFVKNSKIMPYFVNKLQNYAIFCILLLHFLHKLLSFVKYLLNALHCH